MARQHSCDSGALSLVPTSIRGSPFMAAVCIENHKLNSARIYKCQVVLACVVLLRDMCLIDLKNFSWELHNCIYRVLVHSNNASADIKKIPKSSLLVS